METALIEYFSYLNRLECSTEADYVQEFTYLCICYRDVLTGVHAGIANKIWDYKVTSTKFYY